MRIENEVKNEGKPITMDKISEGNAKGKVKPTYKQAKIRESLKMLGNLPPSKDTKVKPGGVNTRRGKVGK